MKIQEKSNMIWKYQRFQLIYEYREAPILPPPLSILIYIWKFSKLLKNFLIRDCKEEKINQSDSDFRGKITAFEISNLKANGL